MVEVAISSIFSPPTFGPGGNPDGHGYSSGRQMSGMFKVLEKTGDFSQVARSGAEDLATLGLEYFDWSTIIPYSYQVDKGVWKNGGRTLEDLSDPDEVGGDRIQRIIKVQNRMNIDSSIKQAVVGSEDFGDGRSYFYLITRDSTDSNKISGLAIEYQGTITEFNNALQSLNTKSIDHSKNANGFDTPLFFREDNKVEVSDILDASLGSYRNPQRRFEMKPYLDKLKTDVADFPQIVFRHEEHVQELSHRFQKEMLDQPDVVAGLSAAVHGMNRIAETWIEQNQTQYQSRLGIPKQSVPDWVVDTTPMFDYVADTAGHKLSTVETGQDSQRGYKLREQREETILAAYQSEQEEEDDEKLKRLGVKAKKVRPNVTPEAAGRGLRVVKQVHSDSKEEVVERFHQVIRRETKDTAEAKVTIPRKYSRITPTPERPAFQSRDERLSGSEFRPSETSVGAPRPVEKNGHNYDEDNALGVLIQTIVTSRESSVQEQRGEQAENNATVIAVIGLVQQIVASNQLSERSEEIRGDDREIISVTTVTQTVEFEVGDSTSEPLVSIETSKDEQIGELITPVLVGLAILQLDEESPEVNKGPQDVTSAITTEEPEQPINIENEIRKMIAPAIIYLINEVEIVEKPQTISVSYTDADFEKAAYDETVIQTGTLSINSEATNGINEVINIFYTLSELEEALGQVESEISKEDRDIVKVIQLEIQEASMVVVPAFLASVNQLSTTNVENLEEQIIDPISKEELLGSNVEDILILDSEEFSEIWQEVFELMLEEQVPVQPGADEKKEISDESIHRSVNKIQRLEIITEQVQQAIDLIVNYPISDVSSQLELEDYEGDQELPEVFQETVDLSKKLLDVVTKPILQGEFHENEISLAKLFILTKLFEKEELSRNERKILIALMYQQIKQINPKLISRSQPLEQLLEEVEVRLDFLMESEGVELSSALEEKSTLVDKLIFLLGHKNKNVVHNHVIPTLRRGPIGILKQVQDDDKSSVRNDMDMLQDKIQPINTFHSQVIHIVNSFSTEERLGKNDISHREIEVLIGLRQKVLSLLLLEAEQNGIEQEELIITNERLAKEPDYILILIPNLLVELNYQPQQIWEILKLLQINIDKLGNIPQIGRKRPRKTPIELEGMLFERFKLRRKRIGTLNKKVTLAHFGVIYQYRTLVMEVAFMTQ